MDLLKVWCCDTSYRLVLLYVKSKTPQMFLNQVVAKHDFQIVYRKLSLVEFIFKIFNCENQLPTQLMDVFLFAGMNS